MEKASLGSIDDILIPTKSSGKFGSFRMTYEGIEELGFSEKRGPYSDFLTGCRCFINKVFINLDDEFDKTVHLNLKIIDKTGREIEEETTLSEIMTPEGIKTFGAIGLDCTRKNANSLSAFLQSQYDLNLGRFETAYIVGSNGWKKDGSYVFGNVRYEEGGKKSIIKLTNESESDIMGGLGKKGSVVVYSKETKPFFNDWFVRSTMYFKTASMIAKLLNVGNKMKTVFGTSSHGKTLTEMLNASHEGNPSPQDKNGLLFSADNTKWRLEKLAAHRSGRCLYFDESNGVDPDLVKHLVNGVGRGRRNPGKNKGSDNFDEERWNAFFIYSAEHPIIEESADMGAFVRIMNSEVDNKETGIEVFEDTKRIARIKEKILPNNYGHIIEPLIETIFEYKSQLQEMYDDYYDKYSELISCNPVEQNRVQAYAITALGGFLLERTFEKVNVKEGAEFDIQDSDKTVKYYFEKEVCDTPIENTGLKELRRLVGWVNMNESSFLPNNFGKVEVTSEEITSCGESRRTVSKGRNPSFTRYGALREDIDRLYIIPQALKAVFFKDSKNREYLFNYLIKNEAIELIKTKDEKGKERVNETKPVRLLLGDEKTQRVYSLTWSKINELIGNVEKIELPVFNLPDNEGGRGDVDNSVHSTNAALAPSTPEDNEKLSNKIAEKMKQERESLNHPVTSLYIDPKKLNIDGY
jgi:uncharacterized protein (DUF927 family)